MTNISLCHGEHCPIRDECYRHTAKPIGDYQSWLSLTREEQDGCEYFWPVKEADSEQSK